MVLSKHATHYHPRSGFLYYNLIIPSPPKKINWEGFFLAATLEQAEQLNTSEPISKNSDCPTNKNTSFYKEEFKALHRFILSYLILDIKTSQESLQRKVYCQFYFSIKRTVYYYD